MINISTITDTINHNLGTSNLKFSPDSAETTCDFIGRNYQCLDRYYLERVKNESHIKFSDLKNVYLLDKEIRMYLFNVIEEIEVYLKSFLFVNNGIDLLNTRSYHDMYLIPRTQQDNKNKVQESDVKLAIDFMKKNKKEFTNRKRNLFLLSFTSISKLIQAIFDNSQGKQFLQPMIERLEYGSHKDLSNALRDLSSLRNSIAHHDSIIHLVTTKKKPKKPDEQYKNDKYYKTLSFNDKEGGVPQRIRSVLKRFHELNMRIRQDDVPGKKLQLLEDEIRLRTESTTQVREFLGYGQTFSKRIIKV